ncbi:PAAR domain-containing protein [Geomonas sp. Red32]|uniref:PAAR domain-containing protein n=1 Tax=Geomonas sp. Red32 TaxID=2912856 RepID=UPI00202CD62E|nr:PAAR domain-containing protein [Geomonas sp. Red32]MCM0082527.1 PAAR domain-containing protein [Geomonas sp. Red32]
MPIYFNCDALSGRPAARIGDSVSCPIHGETSIVSGSPNTYHDNQPAARVGDRIACGDTIIEGSNCVLINGKPAAFVGCSTAHGGKITSGSSNVFIGRTPGGLATVPAETTQDGVNHSLAFDLSEMLAAGNHNGIEYAGLPIEITTTEGEYVTTVSTDERGVSSRFFTTEQRDVIAWVIGAEEWEVIEEMEVVDDTDALDEGGEG